MKRRVTSLEVARRAGVSRTTVSFVLNGVQTGKVSEATRTRVLRAARELGYVPDAAARTLVSGKTGTIGLVVSRAEHIGVDAFIPQTLQSLAKTCSGYGYHLLIETAEGSTTYDYDQLVSAKRIDGLVVLNPDPADERLGELIDREYPVALIGSYPHPGAAAVSVDSVQAMDRLVTHLVELGHERIGFIHYREMTGLETGGRFRGFRTALERAGLSLVERWIRPGGYSAASGYEVMRAILAEPELPTAIVAGNDTIAIGAISAAIESGRRVPGDLAIAGFDDIPLARYVNPPLTTVRLPAPAMARTCGLMLHTLIETGTLEQRKRVFDADLVIRASCGADGDTRSA